MNERAARYGQPGREGAGVTEAAKEGCALGKNGQDAEAEAEEEDRARKVTTAGARPERRARCRRVDVQQLGRGDRSVDGDGVMITPWSVPWPV